jgi:acetyl-CoA carboxylase biotin carboxyl carrier protein
MAKKSKPIKGGSDALAAGFADIERVLTFMQEHGLEELAYERPGIHIHLRKPSTHPAGVYRAISNADIAVAAAATPGHAAAPSAASAGSKERAADTAPAGDVHVIKSPIVGTYYAAPGPDAAPFVALGNKVEVGQVLCIIEAMKLMNEIESDVAGEVVLILVENGHPVEYGQPLFGIRPKGKK